ncbi:hypothetical protein EVAR_53330_1 [Eumeta japonica]|uniref:Uncharacterized protein n=1 Tax=Eumeta variegata TaxID=151549 RepID=A0A4C1X5V3_EUMVA|nr:hypothetical protein EVAR_53330_1 [Eumeta japonica]
MLLLLSMPAILPHGSKQTSYTSTGFRNWKNATDSKTGFPKHEKSISHIQAMSMWQEKLQRISTSSSVETLINQKVLEKYRYYVKSIMEVIQFLIVNELALRGNYILEEEKEQGLFQNLFEYTSIRYVKDGVVNESLLMVKTTENLDAATFTELTLNTLTENNIDPSCMLSQCYDGPWLWPKILSTLQPADAALQARSAGLKDAITIIKCVKDEIIKLRSNQMYNQILEEAKSLTSNDCGESENRTQTSKRQVKKPNRMDDYLTYTPCSSARQNIDENDEPFKSEYFETLDILIAELQRRFSDNDDLINSIASLDELDVDKMVPLKNLGLKIPSREEASVVKAYLSRNEDIMENTLQVLYRQREAFKDTYELFASVATIGCSTAVCESTFSTLTAINRPQRLSMGHERMAGMVSVNCQEGTNRGIGTGIEIKSEIVIGPDSEIENDIKNRTAIGITIARNSFNIHTLETY